MHWILNSPLRPLLTARLGSSERSSVGQWRNAAQARSILASKHHLPLKGGSAPWRDVTPGLSGTACDEPSTFCRAEVRGRGVVVRAARGSPFHQPGLGQLECQNQQQSDKVSVVRQNEASKLPVPSKWPSTEHQSAHHGPNMSHG